jgi:hypothetical protein
LDLGLIAGVLAIVACIGCIVCLVLLRKRRVAMESGHEALRCEFTAMVHTRKSECLEEVARVGREVALLESSGQEIAGLTCGFARPLRAQAMALLRSGTPPQKVAQELGIARREMRLIAQVSRILAPE